jgi:antitoxin component of MazEF toxin-antitoxin module
MDHIRKVKVVQQGKNKASSGSLYVVIPQELCQKLLIVKGDVVDIFSDGDRVVYSKVKA